MAHILMINDDEQFREILVQMLGQDARRVTVAHDGEEGLRLMPRMDGIEAIMALA